MKVRRKLLEENAIYAYKLKSEFSLFADFIDGVKNHICITDVRITFENEYPVRNMYVKRVTIFYDNFPIVVNPGDFLVIGYRDTLVLNEEEFCKLYEVEHEF